MTITKKCVRCGNVAEHGIRKQGAPQPYCRECHREFSRQHYADNKETYNTKRLKRQREQRRKGYEITNAAKDTPCFDCKRQYPSYVMQFDHRDPTKKRFTIAEHVRSAGSLKDLVMEIAKCDVVCANCHAERSHKQRNG